MAKTAVFLATLTMLTGTPAASHASDGALRLAAVVCSGGGCNVVHTKQIKHRSFKPMEYTKPLPKTS